MYSSNIIYKLQCGGGGNVTAKKMYIHSSVLCIYRTIKKADSRDSSSNNNSNSSRSWW